MKPHAAALALLALVSGCAEKDRRPDGWPAGFHPHVAVVLTGTRATDDRQARCLDQVVRAGGVVDPIAPVRAVVRVDDGANRLQVISRARGVVRDQELPAWDVGRLCREALLRAAYVAAAEPPPGARRPPPIVPIRAGDAPSQLGVPPRLLEPDAAAPAQVRALARAGVQRYQAGDWAGALAAFGEANRVSPSDALLFDTALCYQRLGRLSEALQYVSEYLEHVTDGENRRIALELRAELRAALDDNE